MAIPHTLADINTAWLTKVLARQTDSASVLRCDLQPLQRQGATAMVARVILVFDKPTNFNTVIVKLAPEDRDVFDRYNKLGFYQREVGFYSDLPNPGIDVPTCYFAEQDTSGRFALVLEDLGNQYPPNSSADIGLALQRIAKLHAAWWDDRTLRELVWCNDAAKQAMQQARGQDLAADFLRFEPIANQFLPKPMIGFAQRWVNNYTAALTMTHQLPATLVHGDFWPDQLFFNGDGTLCVLDWQSCHLNSAAVDVARIISDSLARGLPRAACNELIDAYLNELSRLGVSLDLKNFKTDYAIALAGILDLWISHTVRLEPTRRRGMRRFFETLTESFDEHDVLQLAR